MNITKNDIIIGSQLWIEPRESMDEIENNVRGMLDNGLVIARIFLFWDSVEPERDQWNFSKWDNVFALCEKLGMKLTVTLTADGDCGWIRREHASMAPSLSNWEFIRERATLYVQRVVERYKNSSILHSWILWNEPHYIIKPDACTLEQFRRWLLIHYKGDLEKIRHSYAPSMSLEQIGVVRPDGSAELAGVTSKSWTYASRVDWALFNQYMLEYILTSIHSTVKKLDSIHPTTVNVDSPAQVSPDNQGRSLFGMGKIVDFLGCSSHVSWHSTRFPISRIHQSVAMYCDLMRSATNDPDGYFWITELQAGTNYFSGERPMVPTGSDITHWLWEAIGTGCKGVIYWLYRARESGVEGLEWGLMNQQGSPSRRSKASKCVSDVLYANRELFTSLRPKQYDGYILHSYDSMVLASAERQDTLDLQPLDVKLARNSQLVQDACCGAYMLLQDMGLDVGFIPENDFSGILSHGSLLIAPNTYALSAAVVENLHHYVMSGGTLIVDGLFGCKDPYGQKSNEHVQGMLTDLFSSPVNDWEVYTEEFNLFLPDGKSLPAWYLSCIWDNEDKMEVLARDSQGSAAAICHTYGKGRAIYIGTQFFQNYFAKGGDIVGYADFLSRLLPSLQRPYLLHNSSGFLRMKHLQGDSGEVLIVLNRGEENGALISAHIRTTFTDLLSGEVFVISVLPEKTVIPMKAQQVRVLI